MSIGEPSSYPRRILLSVTGLTPQVVTETLYALIQAESAFVPTEVHLITTREGAERARLALLSEDPGWFRRFCKDFRLPEIALDETRIRVLTDGRGEHLDDIRTPEDNQRAADLITETVRELTSDPGTALHVSIAGGRKTMGYYLGYALALYGRPQDRLSHVLVSEPFESSWDFFYPTPYERVIQTRDQKLANAADARVTLAEIPFVSLRQGLPKRLLSGATSFTGAVASARRAQAPPRLTMDLAKTRAWADDEPLDLGQTEFVTLLWFAERARGEDAEIDWTRDDAAREFLETAKRVINPASGSFERLEKAFQGRWGHGDLLGDYFEPQKTRVNQTLGDALGERAAQRYQIRRAGRRGASRYYLPLSAEQIEIRD